MISISWYTAVRVHSPSVHATGRQMEGLHDQEDRTSIEIEEGKPCGSRARLSTPPHDEGKATAGFQTSRAFTSSSTEAESRAEDQQPVGHTPLLKNIAATRVRMCVRYDIIQAREQPTGSIRLFLTKVFV